MRETSKYTVFNIREYLGNGSHGLGEDTLLQVLSEFSCKINPDVLSDGFFYPHLL